MLLDVLLAVIGLLGLVVAAVSERIRRLPLSEPLLALVVGALLGPAVLGVLSLAPLGRGSEGTLHEMARLLLAVSVMGVALRYPARDLRPVAGPVALLLLVAMPAMALLTTGLSMAVLGLALPTALLLGAALCPTDPVLASSVVTGDPAEADLPARNRQILSLESGANDGLALPLVLVAVAVAGPTGAGATATEAAWQVGGAALLGAAAGGIGGRAHELGRRRREMGHGPMLLFTILLAFATLGVGGLLHVDAVLAVFVAGLVFNLVGSGSERTAEVEIDEAVNRFGVLPFFAVLGATVPWGDWRELGSSGVLLAVAVLLLRRLPVLLLLARPLRLRWPDAVFVGWFGPVGVSALLYLTLEAERLDLPDVVLAAGSLVVVASTVAHGLTASPGRVLYRRVADATGSADRREVADQ